MQCPKCLTFNGDNATFCDQCGAPLDPRAKGRGGRSWLVPFLLLCLVGVAVWAYFQPPRETDSGKTAGAPTTVKPSRTSSKEVTPLVSDTLRLVESTRGVAVGRVSVRDRWGGDVREYVGAVVNESWVALPRSVCLAGAEVVFRPNEPEEGALVGVVWREGEDLALWQLEAGKNFDGPDLAPWDDRKPVEWLPYDGGDRRKVDVGETEDKGLFLLFSLPLLLEEPGVLIQEDVVVGWTFGSVLEGGWLWNGALGEPRAVEMYDEDFYRITFGDGREERFLEAISRQQETSPRQQLALLAEGFLLRGKLPSTEVPEFLTDEQAVVRMRNLVPILDRQQNGAAVIALLSEGVLVAAGSAPLLLQVAELTIQEEGVARAIETLERVEPQLIEVSTKEAVELSNARRELYLAWVRDALENGNLADAWYAWEQATGAFPKDGELHLLGVELAIADEDAREARRLLAERRYSGELLTRSWELENLIRELELPEGRVVIRFEAGATSVVTDAVLDGRHTQTFIVDTGATITTVPSKVVRSLGISTRGAPMRRVKTAGNEVTVPSVTIDSINLGGAIVRDLEVLVMDLPNQGDIGLLGNNFLRNFRVVDLDHKRGRMVLEPL